MHYRKLGKTGLEVSALGFGCMRLPTITPGETKIDREEAIRLIRKGIDNGINYIDTAYPYHDGESETVVGLALKDGYREKVTLVTKSPLWLVNEEEDFDKFLDEQLGKLDVEYLDVYLLHAINAKQLEEKVHGLKLIDKGLKAKEDGKIKHLGFSFHDKPEVLKEIIDTGKFEVMLVQYNLLDKANEEMISYAAEKGLGVAIMGPVGGGRLAGTPSEELKQFITEGEKTFADMALKFVWNNPGVTIALSGMGTEEMVDQNIALVSAENYDEMTDDEKERANKFAEKVNELTEVICTNCKYCEPCPEEVNISTIFRFLVNYQVYGQQESS
ncbi:MAG: aldo/keto reductase, partial [Candidatus Heimdallarchaeota archaeon]|nr:aldo/keto reductase [Candidatus Heimdallarchaeota archaeon]MCK5050055.1 aldo/keto reductase [Candidatus Heimdallarchaeota archaeon]